MSLLTIGGCPSYLQFSRTRFIFLNISVCIDFLL